MGIQQLWDRGWRMATERKEIRYIESGVAGEIIEYVTFLFIYWPTQWLYFASSASYIISAIAGFSFHKFWSFKGEQEHKSRHQVMAYAVMSGTNFFLTNIIIGFFVYRMHVRPSYSKLLAIAITAIWSFGLSNFVIFRHKKPVEEATAPA